jgi:phosphoesterase RecJ-like protein
LAPGLREYGKTAYVLPNPDTTPRFLRYVEEYHAPAEFKPDCVIAVDTASYDVFNRDAEEYIGNVTLCIDHHESNKKYAKYTCLDGLASCGELIYELLIELSGEISTKTAECLYVAVSTDTGCFAYANTTANTLRTAALLVEAGAPQKELNKSLFRTKSMSRIKIEGMVYSNIEFFHDGKVAIMIVTREMMEESGAIEDDVDDISAIPIAVEGVRVGITLRTLECGTGKGSIRSMQGFNSNEIAARFGGGGHPTAAGFSFDVTIEEQKEKLLEILPEFLADD